MLIHRALKMRIYPNRVQQQAIDATLNGCRYIYNQMLERQNKAYKRRGEHLSYNDMQNLLPGIKQYRPWLKDTDSQALKYACRELDDAFKRFFKKQCRYPRFHSKRASVQSYSTTHASSIHYVPGRITIPCIGAVRCSDRRKFTGQICKVTISRASDDRYYASLLYKTEIDVPVAIGDKAIGLDYSSGHSYVDSEGRSADMPHWYRKSQNKLAKAQRRLKGKSGCHKGERRSRAFTKQMNTIRKIQRKTTNQRRDWLQKESTRLVDTYDIICIEDLDMKAMSNKGFGNGKATLDNGYGAFTTMLEYKLCERGKHLVKVGRWYPSSQTCHNCGAVSPITKDLTIRNWTCPVCGEHHDRDVNAALNIRDEGLRMLTSPPLKKHGHVKVA